MGRAIRPGGDQTALRGSYGQKRGKPWALILFVVVALGVTVVVTTMAREEPARGDTLASLPASAIGTWITADERFANRLLLVMDDQILMDRGVENPPGGGRLLEARTWDEEGTQVIAVQYRGEEGVEGMEMLFPGDGTLMLRNPPDVVWTKR